MILAADNFRDTEYITPKAFFEQAGFEVTTAGPEPQSVGRFGYRVIHEELIHTAVTNDYDAVLFVGGGGSLQLENNTDAQRLAQESKDQEKVLGAICAAPRNLLSWGILKDLKCTGHDWDGQFSQLCSNKGAIYKEKNCVVDRNIITANGPEAAEEWALGVIDMINKSL